MGEFFRLASVEAFNVVVVQCAQIAVAFFFAKKIKKVVDNTLITRVCGLFGLDRLRL